MMAVRVAVWLLWVWFTAGAAACQDQEPPEGKMKCADDSECPSGWFCDPADDFCYKSENDAGD